MSRPLRTLLVLCLAALVVGGLAAQPAMAAKKKEACWKTLINDWYDGVIDDRYKLACYREAMDRLDSYPDLNNYSTAREDINRAYQARIAEIRKSRNRATNPKPTDPDKNEQRIPAVVCPCPSQPPTGPGNEVATPTPPTPPVTDPPVLPTNNEKPTKASEQGPKVVRLPTSPQPPTVGRTNDDKGPIGNGIKAVGPDTADGMPIPLLVLGGLALVLMLGGALGFVTRRMQSRRPPMRPATAPADTRRR